jgi:hypothetical protein
MRNMEEKMEEETGKIETSDKLAEESKTRVRELELQLQKHEEMTNKLKEELVAKSAEISKHYQSRISYET